MNFSLFSRSCYAVELLLFDDAGRCQACPGHQASIPRLNKTFYYWHCLRARHHVRAALWLPGAWALRPRHGAIPYDGQKVLLDPYAKAVVPSAGTTTGSPRAGRETTLPMPPNAVVVDPSRV
ncbi:MAG: hypothetical protein M0C28_31595 [Candidatus Moduliflexus flocculans]|nr:hypothetical protein [Candidatus Moduliflexus flocculans]